MTDEERARTLLVALDEIARRDDPHNYGLPLFSDRLIPILYQVVLAYEREERRRVWDTVLSDLDCLGLLHGQVTMSDEMTVFVNRCRQQAREEETTT